MENTVCCFGNKVIFGEEDGAEEIISTKEWLKQILLVKIKNGAKIFMTGREGEFENLFAAVVREMKISFPHIKLFLIEPGFSKSIELYKEYYEKMYDDILVCPWAREGEDDKRVLTRNKWMINNSYHIIVCVTTKIGDEYIALKYAELMDKFVINMYNL